MSFSGQGNHGLMQSSPAGRYTMALSEPPAVQTSEAQLTVLLIEDNAGDARLLMEYLSEAPGNPFVLERVELLSEGLDRLQKGGIALVLLDLSLPDSFGLETFARAHASAPEVPIIVMSGRDDESLAIKTVHEGAQDYLVKGQVDSRLLVRSMRYAIERKRTEEALAKERDLLHTLLENLPDRIYFKDEQSRFLRISRAVMEQFKLKDPAEAVGKSDVDFFSQEHAQVALNDERLVMRTGEPIIGKVERETLPDGTVTWALTSKLPMRDKSGRIIGNFGISRDITAIKKIESELAEERNLLRSLIDNLPDYIYVKDPQYRYVLDNIAHRNFLGANSEQEVIGKKLSDFFPQAFVEQFAHDDQTIIEQGQVLVNREELFVDPRRGRRWHATTKVPLRNNEGQIIGLVGISRDITERKEAEEKLQQANTELARSKAELESVFADLQRSHDELKAAQFQLIQAEKMQSVGRLAAGVAHEVKNPLAILGMGIDYMMKNLASPDQNVALILTDMNDALKRADRTILGLLDFSVPRALDLHSEDLSEIVEQSIAFVKHELANAPIRLVRELGAGLPPVYADKHKIKQVLVNILSNAIHAMPSGGTLTVRTYSKQLHATEVSHDAGWRLADRFREGETVVMCETIDTGTGIAPEKLAKIFDPFFTTKPTGKGTGLGLTVTKKIVELHGGSIDIRNRTEGGVIVTLMFKV
jgi:PAS domain S-box-containing protein